MSDFAEMSMRHGYGLQRLAEMTGKLAELSYLRAIRADDDHDKDRASLVFDRLARGFRLTLALEAKLARDRRRDVREIAALEADDAALPSPATAPPVREGVVVPLRPPVQAAAHTPDEPEESDTERESDGDAAELSPARRIEDLQQVVREAGSYLDPAGTHAADLEGFRAWWAEGQHHAAPADAARKAPGAKRPRRKPRRDPAPSLSPSLPRGRPNGGGPPWNGSG